MSILALRPRRAPTQSLDLRPVEYSVVVIMVYVGTYLARPHRAADVALLQSAHLFTCLAPQNPTLTFSLTASLTAVLSCKTIFRDTMSHA